MTKAPTPLLPLPPGCVKGRFLRREKRFLVQVELDSGPTVWVHTNNSGSMTGLLAPGNPVLVSPAANPARKLKYTLELIRAQGVWSGVNTLVPNRLLRAAFDAGLLPGTGGFTDFKAEAKVGDSRLDARLSGPEDEMYVECKNVTLVEDGAALFPDAVTVRGQKHMAELARLSRSGVRAACFFLAQRGDARCFAPADFIDPDYALALDDAVEAGVEIWAYAARPALPEGNGNRGGLDLGPALPPAPWWLRRHG